METRPQDLRIGNLIQDVGESAEVYTVDMISETRIRAGAMTIYPAGFEILHYIPLTPEWLERFSFRSDLEGWYWKPTGKNSYIAFNPHGVYLSVTDQHDESDSKHKDEFSERLSIEFVHQLQNLYFILTNEELTLKP